MSAAHVLVELFPAAVIVGTSLLAVEARLNRPWRGGRIPADVDLSQAVATTRAIVDAGPQQYRAGRARGYGRSRA